MEGSQLVSSRELRFGELLKLEWSSFLKYLASDENPARQGILNYDFLRYNFSDNISLSGVIEGMNAVWFTQRDFDSRLSRRKGKERKVFRSGVEARDYGEKVLRDYAGAALVVNPVVGEYKIWGEGVDMIRRVDLYFERNPLRKRWGTLVEGIGLSFSEIRSFGEKFPREKLVEELYSIEDKSEQKCA